MSVHAISREQIGDTGPGLTGLVDTREQETTLRRDFWLRRRGMQVRLFGLSCLTFLAYPAAALGGESPLLYLGVAAFAAGFVRVVWRNTPRLHANRAPLTIVATLFCGGLMVPALHYDWLSGLAFYASVMLLLNCPLRWWPATVGIITVSVVAVAALVLRADQGSIITLIVLQAIGSGVQVAIYKQIETSMQLREARAELTQLAVAEERLRIARDLHDVLGQRLTAVTLKSEVAARMVRRDPGRAITEITEVGTVARDALAEVRAVVSGYRKLSWTVEAQSAEALLAASGVAVNVRGPLDDLPAPVDDCAAWLIREATTNVLRHATAQRCEIAVSRTSDTVFIEVSDDGVGARMPEPPASGTGLTGLAERVRLAGGEFFFGPRERWFVVSARLPAECPPGGN